MNLAILKSIIIYVKHNSCCSLWYVNSRLIPINCRGRKFYGKTIDEAVQAPGETIYAPNHIHHSVYNLDETVAVGDNPYFNTALEESAYELYHKKHIYFAHLNGTEIVIHNGWYE